MDITVSAITSQLQWNRSQTGCIAVTTYVWLMLKQAILLIFSGKDEKDDEYETKSDGGTED